MNAIELAKRLLADGYNKFVGNGLLVEFRSKRPAIPQKMKCVILDAEYSYAPECGYVDNWLSYAVARPDKPTDPLTVNLDSALPAIKKFPVGSMERLDAMADFVEQNERKDISPFGITLADIADRLAGAHIELPQERGKIASVLGKAPPTHAQCRRASTINSGDYDN